jgi:hypothetical protein
MTIENHITNALDIVSATEVPVENFTQAVMDQACLMAGMDMEPSTDSISVSPYLPLRF